MAPSIRLLLLLLALTLSRAAYGACDGRLVGDVNAGSDEYDPFSVIDFRRRQTVSVRNVGSETCDFLVGFRRQPADGLLGPALPYRLTDNAGLSLLSDQAPPHSGRFLVLANVQPGQVSSADYYLTIPRGQFASAGNYSDDAVAMLLHGRPQSKAIGAELDNKALLINLPVKPVVAINIAGGGLRTTLNFDALAKGKERTVMLQTQANYAYSLALSSTYASQLTLDPEVPGQVWRIPYSLRVDNAPVSLQSAANLTRLAPVSADGRESHLLVFRIEDALGRRAGLYRDFVTVDIHVRP
jgi:hypothetical protein